MEFRISLRRENRNTLENPTMPISSASIMEFLGLGGGKSAAGVNVTPKSALGVPAVWSAVNFLSGTMAGLPLQIYEKTKDGRHKVKNSLFDILHDVPNPGCSSFQWRKHLFEGVFTGGRGISFIEHNPAGLVTDIWSLDPRKVTVKRKAGVQTYHYREGNKTTIYQSTEIIDIPFMLDQDMVHSISPLARGKDAIGLAIAASNYASRAFAKGALPTMALQSDFGSAQSVNRAAEDVAKAIDDVNDKGGSVLTMPAGTNLSPLAFNPEQMQLVEMQRFCIEQIARIYSIPPVFLQDLTHGTFSNTEQQDLQFVKHTLKRWIEQFEQELNLKLFGRQSSFGKKQFYVEMNVDGLLRGDFKTRMDGTVKAIQGGLLTPNEGRKMDNRPPLEGGDSLMIQGATVPITVQLQSPATGGK
ncbi:MAG: phage portal protein [Alphaproteobacteria bacterium]|nr:MAG: phage portal protein [Alphaproteobacteria bacterium]